MKTAEQLSVKQLAVEEVFSRGGIYLEPIDAFEEGFIAGYNKAKEWIELTDDTCLKEGLYLCKWESGNKNEYQDEIKVRFWNINFNDAYFVDEDCEYDENITHYRFID